LDVRAYREKPHNPEATKRNAQALWAYLEAGAAKG